MPFIETENNLEQILNNTASGMSAQSIRMNTVASNIANADSISGDPGKTYRAKHPVFSEVKQSIPGIAESEQPLGGVRVTEIKNSQKPLEKRYEPDNPQSDENGYIYLTDVNQIEEMTNMIEASREYQANVEVMNTTKSLLLQTIKVLDTK